MKVCEKWIAGTYVVTGFEVLAGESLSVPTMTHKVLQLYSEARRSRKGRWPRGIAGFFICPIYVAEDFSDDVKSYAVSPPRYRWAIWHKPILIARATNQIYFHVHWGLFGAAFRPYLISIVLKEVSSVAKDASFGANSIPADEKLHRNLLLRLMPWLALISALAALIRIFAR